MATKTEIATNQTSTSTSSAPTVGPTEASEALRSGRARLIDVREVDEHRHERIEGSMLLPMSRWSADEVPRLAQRGTDAIVIVHCRSGKRSASAVRDLLSRGDDQVFSLAGGIEGWKAAGLSVVRGTSAPIPVMRQVQVTVGVLLLASVLLTVFVSPWFIAVPAVLGTGLTFAGATGWCGMAMMLGAMPWNRERAACEKGSCDKG